MLTYLGILLVSILGVFCSIMLPKHKPYRLYLLILAIISLFLCIAIIFYDNETLFFIAQYLSWISALIPAIILVSKNETFKK